MNKIIASKQAQDDFEKLERRGVRAVQKAMAQIQRAILSQFQYNRSLPATLERMFIAGLFETIRDAMVVMHIKGLQRELRYLKNENLALSVYDSTLVALTRRLKLDVNFLKEKYGIQALRVVRGLSTKTETELQNFVSDLTRQGATAKEGIKLLKQKFADLGVAPKNDFQIETIFRTQTQLSYNAGKWLADQQPEMQEILWGYTYTTVGDDRVRLEHEKLDGVTLPKDDPFWISFWPPNGYNCRCVAIPVFEEREIVQPPEDAAPDEGFDFNAGQVFGTGAQLEIPDITRRIVSAPAPIPKFYDLESAKQYAKDNHISLAVTEAKPAAKALSKELMEWKQLRSQMGEEIAGVPNAETIEKNWLQIFNAKNTHFGNKTAFDDLRLDQNLEIQNSIIANSKNEKFQQFVKSNGEAPIIFRHPEIGNNAAAEWRGAIHVYDSPYWQGEIESDLIPGKPTAGGMTGYAGIIRHEYGHKLFGRLTIDQQKEWVSLVPDSELVKKELTVYAAKNKEETFCELFAIVTDPRYKPGVFPKWVDELHEKQKEWNIKT